MERRQFLFAGPAALLAACGGTADTTGPAGDRADLAILGPALGLELTAIRLYEEGLATAGRHRRLVERLLGHEREHAEGIRQAIVDLRGRPPAGARTSKPGPAPRSTARAPQEPGAWLRFAMRFERESAEAYAAALPRLRSRILRSTLASVLAAEAEHWSALAEAGGNDPLTRMLGL